MYSYRSSYVPFMSLPTEFLSEKLSWLIKTKQLLNGCYYWFFFNQFLSLSFEDTGVNFMRSSLFKVSLKLLFIVWLRLAYFFLRGYETVFPFPSLVFITGPRELQSLSGYLFTFRK